MSKVFCVIMLLFSALAVIRGLETLGSSNPAVLLFWLLVGGACVYKLFKKPSQTS